jgi:hypothetical protein
MNRFVAVCAVLLVVMFFVSWRLAFGGLASSAAAERDAELSFARSMR